MTDAVQIVGGQRPLRKGEATMKMQGNRVWADRLLSAFALVAVAFVPPCLAVEPTVKDRPKAAWEQIGEKTPINELERLVPKLYDEIRVDDAARYEAGKLKVWYLFDGLTTIRELGVYANRKQSHAGITTGVYRIHLMRVQAILDKTSKDPPKGTKDNNSVVLAWAQYHVAVAQADLANRTGDRTAELAARREAAKAAVECDEKMQAENEARGLYPWDYLVSSPLEWRQLARIVELDDNPKTRSAVAKALEQHLVRCVGYELRAIALAKYARQGGDLEHVRSSQFAVAQAQADWAKWKGDPIVEKALCRRLPTYANEMVDAIRPAHIAGTATIEGMLGALVTCDRVARANELEVDFEGRVHSAVVEWAERELPNRRDDLIRQKTRMPWVVGIYTLARFEADAVEKANQSKKAKPK